MQSFFYIDFKYGLGTFGNIKDLTMIFITILIHSFDNTEHTWIIVIRIIIFFFHDASSSSSSIIIISFVD